MRYRVYASFVIEARDENEAHAQAAKLLGLLKGPLVRMGLESEGIKLAYGDGKPTVHAPTLEGA